MLSQNFNRGQSVGKDSTFCRCATLWTRLKWLSVVVDIIATAVLPFYPALVWTAGPSCWALGGSPSSGNLCAPSLHSAWLTSCRAIQHIEKWNMVTFTSWTFHKKAILDHVDNLILETRATFVVTLGPTPLDALCKGVWTVWNLWSFEARLHQQECYFFWLTRWLPQQEVILWHCGRALLLIVQKGLQAHITKQLTAHLKPWASSECERYMFDAIFVKHSFGFLFDVSLAARSCLLLIFAGFQWCNCM